MAKTIGIIGGGQLGRMLAEAAIKLGFKVAVVDPTPNCPAGQVGAEQIVAEYKDREALLKLAGKCDFLTIEFEHINAKALQEAAKLTEVNPSPETIKLIQDKYRQKKFLRTNGFRVAEFAEISGEQETKKAFIEFGGRMLLKSKKESFDGRGNVLITNKSQIPKALEKLAGRSLYAEKAVDFKKELAVMVAKDINGHVVAYPVVETVHERNICTEVYAPADVSLAVARNAEQIAQEAVKKLAGAGVYGIELFLANDDGIFINEMAPRVHNSGHYTLAMCEPSQFTQHILAVTGQVLIKPKLKAKHCCMVNILGERDGPVELKGVEEAEKIPGVSVYIYGKKPTRFDRKMGHINAVAGTIKEAKTNAKNARQLISI